MPNYQNAMIYKLCCNDLNITDIYIGSTVCFRKRKWQHKHSCNNINDKNYNLKLYKFIRDNGGFENWDMVLVANTPCNSKLQLSKHERHYYEKLNATLNSYCPGRTKKEWLEKNKDIIKIKEKKYVEANKEIIKIKKKEYYKANKEIKKIKSKIYYHQNKIKIKEKASIKINCPLCGTLGAISRLKRHQKTLKCQKLRKTIEVKHV